MDKRTKDAGGRKEESLPAMPDSSAEDAITKETCPALYRPPAGGEEEPHEHRVRKVTRKQVYVERVAEDGSLPQPDADPDGQWVFSRRELERYGSAYHTTTRVRFYRSREEAQR
jgi:hypothetical protein